MDTLIAGLAEHGYGILFAAVFLETVGMPIPAALALLVAGGASAHGSLRVWQAYPGALAAMLAGDTLMFLMGRYTGWWLLGILCRVSLNPESCILRSADSFHKRGRIMLVFAKFVPGINTIAPPLAGSMNMRFSQFLQWDLAGAFLYVTGYFWAGYLFSDALGSITYGYHAVGRVIGWVFLFAVIVYLGLQVRMWFKTRKLDAVPLADPAEAARAVAEGAAIYDVRSHGYYDPRATRIKGSHRLDPNSLHLPEEKLPEEKKVYLYCTCIREATSSVVARELIAKGVQVAVIRGGLRKWKKAGLPTEAVPAEEMAALPVFDR
ncbi:MAG TPA: VTT domain-containing protein [Bryobacteraceae bacterium]|jgi:membrane protein DedA with SNARE-associated domain